MRRRPNRLAALDAEPEHRDQQVHLTAPSHPRAIPVAIGRNEWSRCVGMGGHDRRYAQRIERGVFCRFFRQIPRREN